MAVFRIPVKWTWPGSGSPGVNVFHLRTTEDSGTPGNSLIVDDALDVLDTFMNSVYDLVGWGGAAYTIGEDIVDVSTDEQETATVRTGSVGNAAQLAPPVLAIVVGWKTTLAARRGRGRTFLGPVHRDTIQADGTIDPTILQNVRIHVDTFTAASNAIAGGSFAVWGQQTAGVPGINVARDITSGVVRDRFAVLRSRRD